MNDLSIILLFTSFIAGILTVFAPCVFTFLPVILGTSNVTNEKNYKKAITIILSLGISVFVFSLLLKASTLLITIPQSFWDIIAGAIILIQGILLLYPKLWEAITLRLDRGRSSQALGSSTKYKGIIGDIFTGIALGPIFSSCSPTYGFIIGTLLQSTFSVSLLYLIVYILGVCLILFLIALLGQAFVTRFRWGTNPEGTFKRILAVVFIAVGLLIFTGYYKQIETFIIDNLPFLDVTRLDLNILQETLKQ